MEQIAFKMRLRAGHAAEYRRRHDELWPALAQALHAAGIRDYSIFLDEDTSTLFAVLRRLEGHRMDDLPRLAVMQDWWRHMADIMETHPDGSPWQRGLAAMFHMD